MKTDFILLTDSDGRPLTYNYQTAVKIARVDHNDPSYVMVYGAGEQKVKLARAIVAALNHKPERRRQTAGRVHPTRACPCPTCGFDGSYSTDDL